MQSGTTIRVLQIKGDIHMVLIKDMDNPKSCSECSLKGAYYGECNAKHKRIKTYIIELAKPEWCPLTEVEPYGPDGVLYKEK